MRTEPIVRTWATGIGIVAQLSEHGGRKLTTVQRESHG